MYVCLCRAVTDREIRDAIDAGAVTAEDIAERCDEAGTVCLGCLPHIQELLENTTTTTT